MKQQCLRNYAQISAKIRFPRAGSSTGLCIHLSLRDQKGIRERPFPEGHKLVEGSLR